MSKKFPVKLVAAVLGVGIVLSQTAQMISFAEDKQAVQQVEASFTILPIDRATILAGQKFDFRVELNQGVVKPQDIKVTINGKDAEQFFGTKAQFTNANADSAELTLRGVSFPKAVSITVNASVKVNLNV